MSEINFVDTTVRDGAQSLWASMMTTAMTLSVLPIIDRVGFKAIDLTGGGYFGTLIRFLKEDPWERLRLCRRAIKKTPVHGWLRSRGLAQFGSDLPPSVAELFIKLCIKYGVNRFGFLEEENDFSHISHLVKVTKAEGAETVAPLVYSHSPYHTDEYYAQKAQQAVKMGFDIVLIKDSGGLLTPERTRTLVPTIQQNIENLPLEIHSHTTTGLGPLNLLEAIKLGVKTVWTVSSPLANGSSHPSTEKTLMNARRLGYSSNLDEAGLKALAAQIRFVAKKENLPIGVPGEYDIYQYEHQVPGGVQGTLKWQLAQLGVENRLEEVYEEVCRVRKDLGYCIMVTPASQFIVAQATINVLTGERYKEICNEVIRKVLGFAGKSPGPIDQNLRDKVMSLPVTKELLAWEPPQTSIEELRKKIGPGLSDEELILRLCASEEAIKAMRAAGPIKTDYPTVGKPLVFLVQEIMKRRNSSYIHIKKGDFSFTLKKGVK